MNLSSKELTWENRTYESSGTLHDVTRAKSPSLRKCWPVLVRKNSYHRGVSLQSKHALYDGFMYLRPKVMGSAVSLPETAC